jgi:nanoRNase/pAp phosphatase (c-di-AMP/oligoRNAs hydrolase)
MNIIKKIESSEMTLKTLGSLKRAMDHLTLVRDFGFIHMGTVDNPDILVIIADFFMRLSEVSWSVVSGIYEEKCIIILRNAGFRGDAGKIAQKLFNHWGASAGGHKGAARAEIPLENLKGETEGPAGIEAFILESFKSMK